MFTLYSKKVVEIATHSTVEKEKERINQLSSKAKKFLEYINDEKLRKIIPIEVSKEFNVSNKTIINWCVELCNNGFLKPVLVNKRIRSYDVVEN